MWSEILFGCIALCEAGFGLLTWPFRRTRETPSLHYQKTPRNESILSACKTLKSFNPCPWALGGSAQMILSHMRHKLLDPIAFERELLSLQDGVCVALDWMHPRVNMDGISDTRLETRLDTRLDTRPVVMCLHGLGGDSSSPYIQQFARACLDSNWRCCVYNRRGHAGVSLLSTTQKAVQKIVPIHSDLEDMQQVVAHMEARYPRCPKFLVGFSAGSNLGIQFCARFQDQASNPFRAVVSVSNAHDLVAGTRQLEEQHPLANAMMTSFARRILVNNEEDIRTLCSDGGIRLDWGRLKQTHQLRDFEESLICPIYGFETLDEYYRKVSCVDDLGMIRVPMLSIISADDPLIPPALGALAADAARLNSYIIHVATQRGGHLGWRQGWRAESWMQRAIVEYISALGF
jgi:predicted alpha/beta-fold hydrolase